MESSDKRPSNCFHQLIAGSFALSLLWGGAASAQSVTVDINNSFGSTENSGSTAQLLFSNFAQAMGRISFDLKLTNNSPTPPTSTTLVGVAFDLPDYRLLNVSNNFNTLKYNQNSTSFEDLWGPEGASLNIGGGPKTYDIGIRAVRTPNGSVNIQDKASDFNGGNPTNGLDKGQTALVNFSYETLLSAADFEKALNDDFSSGRLKAAGRFQQITEATNGATSDKIGGGIPVPGPLPIVGAGAAFVYSRKLRRRIQASGQLPSLSPIS